MKIRLINEQDWQKIYDFDKSIVRVGSQMNCDVQIKGKDIQPLLLQIVRSGEHDPRFIMRTFADNVSISRGDQVFVCEAVTPQLLMDGDTVSFSSFRMLINLEDEHTRTRTSPHIEAEMFLQKRELQPDMPINGALKLKNLGTEKACQFRMNISGIPNECLKSSPLPYLYPGGEGTVGFMITHLQTRPEPGFHTVSISVSAPEEYFGETLEFNQDIYVMPVFENEIVLDDDSDIMNGKDSSVPAAAGPAAEEKAPVYPEAVSEPVRMDLNQRAYDNEETTIDRSAAVVYKKDPQKEAFSDEESEPERRRATRKKREKVVVIHRDDQKDQNIFDGETDDDSPAEPAAEPAQEESKPTPAAETDAKPEEVKAGSAEIKKHGSETVKTSAEFESKKSSGAKKKKTAKRKEDPAAAASERSENAAPKEPAAAKETVPDQTIPEPAREDPVRAASETLPDASDVAPVFVLPEMSEPADRSSAPAAAADKKAAAEPKPSVKTVKKGSFEDESPAEEKPAEPEPAVKAEKKELFEIESPATEESAEAEPAVKAEKKELFEIESPAAEEPTEAEPAVKAEKKELFEIESPAAEAPAEAEPAVKEEKKELFEIESPAAEAPDEAEPVPAMSTAAETAEAPREEKPEPVRPSAPEANAAAEAAEAPRKDEPEEEPDKPAVIAANIPVIRGAGSMDFEDEDTPAPAPEPAKKAKVVVMKGGKFDE